MPHHFICYKKDGKLTFEDHGGYETRNPSSFWCMQQADALYNWPDFAPMKIYTGDFEQPDVMKDGYNSNKPNGRFHRLIPDWTFHDWVQVGINDYTQTCDQIHTAGLELAQTERVGWIGNPHTNQRRFKMLHIGQQHPQLFDFNGMQWIHDKTKPKDIMLKSTRYMSIPDLVRKYRFLIDIEGVGYSARLKFLLWSHRPLLLVARPHKEYFDEFLKPWEHYIPVKRDLSDLVKQTQWCVDNYDKALEIAENAYKFAQIYLTREACFTKWNEAVLHHIDEENKTQN